ESSPTSRYTRYPSMTSHSRASLMAYRVPTVAITDTDADGPGDYMDPDSSTAISRSKRTLSQTPFRSNPTAPGRGRPAPDASPDPTRLSGHDLPSDEEL